MRWVFGRSPGEYSKLSDVHLKRLMDEVGGQWKPGRVQQAVACARKVGDQVGEKLIRWVKLRSEWRPDLTCAGMEAGLDLCQEIRM